MVGAVSGCGMARQEWGVLWCRLAAVEVEVADAVESQRQWQQLQLGWVAGTGLPVPYWAVATSRVVNAALEVRVAKCRWGADALKWVLVLQRGDCHDEAAG